MTMHRISFTLNGKTTSLLVEPRQSLVDALRQQIGLTGTHLGCEHGVCGACTVLLEGVAVRGCLMLAVQVDGSSIITIEGVSPPQGLSKIQDAMQRHHAVQCGFCTPGMVLTLEALFSENPSPDEREIREAISANLCRCTGYQSIVAAALDVAASNRQAITESSHG